ncbi:MAG: diacylglycerol kinase family protein [Patescibacteria group bacterium]|jgi:diacylglycerol kinase family enzyme
MYTYIVESEINNKKYEADLTKIENRLIELEIRGRVEKLTILKSLAETIKDAVRNQSETIVLIGTDKLINNAISTLAEFKTTIGIIPLGEPTLIAQSLGIPYGMEACDTLSARITSALDLGRVNNRYFLSALHVPDCRTLTLDCDNQFQVSTVTPSTIDISNFSEASNPHDGKLEVIVRPQAEKSIFGFMKKPSYSKKSVFPFKKLTIRSGGDSMPIMADGETIIKTPATIEVVPKRIKIIVGKKRDF